MQWFVLHMVTGLAAAQLPTKWKPQDVITYFCSRWYHQCTFVSVANSSVLMSIAVIKNDTLYLYGGIETVRHVRPAATYRLLISIVQCTRPRYRVQE